MDIRLKQLMLFWIICLHNIFIYEQSDSGVDQSWNERGTLRDSYLHRDKAEDGCRVDR